MAAGEIGKTSAGWLYSAFETQRSSSKNRCWEGACYLAGYSIECGLKACTAKLTERHEFPDKARVNLSYTHGLEALLEVAGMRLGGEMIGDTWVEDAYIYRVN
jgi:hypothetical protein